MKQVNNCTFKTFETDENGFYIDIVEHSEGFCQWDIWLYRNDICIKQYVIGLDRKYHHTIDKVLEIVENYLYIDDNTGLNWFESYDNEFC